LRGRSRPLSEIRIGGAARGDQFRGDLRQRLRRTAPLRPPLHDRPDAIDLDAVAGLRAAAYEPCLLAGCDDLPAGALSRRLRDGGCRTAQDHDADGADPKSMTLHDEAPFLRAQGMQNAIAQCGVETKARMGQPGCNRLCCRHPLALMDKRALEKLRAAEETPSQLPFAVQ
jgi:hypothetical protein